MELEGQWQPIVDPSNSFTCFHWGMGAGRPCSGRQQDGWLTPRSCVGYDTHTQATCERGQDMETKQNKIH